MTLTVQPDLTTSFLAHCTAPPSLLDVRALAGPLPSEKGLQRLNRVHALGRPVVFEKVMSNKSYMKRMYIEQLAARHIFPEIQALQLQPAKRRSRSNRRLNLSKSITLQNVAGHAWTAQCLCTHSRGQLHCRLSSGWASFCKDNNIRLFDRLLFEVEPAAGEPLSMLVLVLTM